jgi:AAA+ ATPase superfamily predicted ATPase
MFRFWYRFVYKNLSKIRLGFTEQVYDDISGQIPDFMGEVFEQICMEYMWKTKLPFSVSEIGRWWGNNPIKKSEQEIDLIAIADSGDKAIFCECKWRNKALGKSIIENFFENCAMFSLYKEKHYYFFSKSGFTTGAREYAKNRDDICLIEFEEMF